MEQIPVPVGNSLLARGGGSGDMRLEQYRQEGSRCLLGAAQDSFSQTTQKNWAKRSVHSTLAKLPTGFLSSEGPQEGEGAGLSGALWEAGADTYLHPVIAGWSPAH